MGVIRWLKYTDKRGLGLATAGNDRYQEIRARIYLAMAHLETKQAISEALDLAQAATALANLHADGRLRPRTIPVRKPAAKLSPAPRVSTTRSTE